MSSRATSMADAVEVETDQYGRVEIINTADVPVPTQQLVDALMDVDPMVASMVRWTREVTGGASRRGGLIERDRYLSPVNTFERIRTARKALDDDVVGGVADLTESLAFKRVGFFCPDEDEQDAWNQWAGTINLDAVLRSAWRYYFTDSQVVFALWWDRLSYKVQGKSSKGVERRKTFDIVAPSRITMLDQLKITPVGNLLFGRERLAYIASKAEADVFDSILGSRRSALPAVSEPGRRAPMRLPMRWDGEPSLDDPVVQRLVVGRYEPTLDERQELQREGIEPSDLFLLDDRVVFRHTATRADFDRFADVRMRSAFELLDLKHQLRQMDRAHLVGGANFIVLIKQGTDLLPAEPEEIAHLRAHVRTIAQVPLIVGDHRLAIEIVTPKLDTTLNETRYDVLDQRLAARLLRQFRPAGNGQSDDTSLAQLAGHWLESERHMLKRTFERHVFGPMHQRNDSLKTVPKMRYAPARIALAFDQAWASFLLDLRASRELSRDTLHGQFELDQADEAAMLEREADQYDDIFQTHVPFDSPAGGGGDGGPDPTTPAGQRAAGRRRGGTRGGGGAAPGSGQGKQPRNPRRTSDGKRPTRAALLEEAKALDIRGRTRMDADELEAAIAAANEEDAEE